MMPVAITAQSFHTVCLRNASKAAVRGGTGLGRLFNLFTVYPIAETLV